MIFFCFSTSASLVKQGRRSTRREEQLVMSHFYLLSHCASFSILLLHICVLKHTLRAQVPWGFPLIILTVAFPVFTTSNTFDVTLKNICFALDRTLVEQHGTQLYTSFKSVCCSLLSHWIFVFRQWNIQSCLLFN